MRPEISLRQALIVSPWGPDPSNLELLEQILGRSPIWFNRSDFGRSELKNDPGGGCSASSFLPHCGYGLYSKGYSTSRVIFATSCHDAAQQAQWLSPICWLDIRLQRTYLLKNYQDLELPSFDGQRLPWYVALARLN